MKRSAVWVFAALVCGACAGGGASSEGRRIGAGLVVEAKPAINALDKPGVQAFTDQGHRLFGFALLTQRGGGVATYLGATLPQTVRVTWRADTVPGKRFTTGRVIADHLVEVDKRVPEDVIRYANAGPGRALRLIFRIKDDGVLFGWDVQETVYHPAGGSGLVNSMRGGDVPCYDLPRAVNKFRDCTEGPLEAATWFNPKWIRGRRPS